MAKLKISPVYVTQDKYTNNMSILIFSDMKHLILACVLDKKRKK